MAILIFHSAKCLLNYFYSTNSPKHKDNRFTNIYDKEMLVFEDHSLSLPCSSYRTKPYCPTATGRIQAGDITEVGGQKARCHQTQRCATRICCTPQD